MKSTLGRDETLSIGESLISDNGYHTLTLQGDGNLVLTSMNSVCFNTGTAGSGARTLIMQSDGNLVLYTESHRPVWSSGTRDTRGGSILVMQGDRNLVVYDSDHKARWASGTNTPNEWWTKVAVEVSPEFATNFAASPEGKPLCTTEPQGLAGAAVATGAIKIVTVYCSVTPTGIAACTAAAIVACIAARYFNANPTERIGLFHADLNHISDVTKSEAGHLSDSFKSGVRNFQDALHRIGGGIPNPFPGGFPHI